MLNWCVTASSKDRLDPQLDALSFGDPRPLNRLEDTSPEDRFDRGFHVAITDTGIWRGRRRSVSLGRAAAAPSCSPRVTRRTETGTPGDYPALFTRDLDLGGFVGTAAMTERRRALTSSEDRKTEATSGSNRTAIEPARIWLANRFDRDRR